MKKNYFFILFVTLIFSLNILGNQNPNNKRILVTYFTVPEGDKATDTDGGASIQIADGKVVGNNQLVATMIQKEVGGDIFAIETVNEYPIDHKKLVDLGAEEKKNNARPKLKRKIENINNYDIIFIGFPNWWADLPMPLYTFLEENDFSGKIIIPFCVHGGSSFSGTIRTITSLQPNATVVNDGLSISRNDVHRLKNEVTNWINSLKELQ